MALNERYVTNLYTEHSQFKIMHENTLNILTNNHFPTISGMQHLSETPFSGMQQLTTMKRCPLVLNPWTPRKREGRGQHD
jgi:hypothetical protein